MTDLQQRCAEIIEWRKTGLYRGTALQALGDRQVSAGLIHADEALNRAEAMTVREALAAVVGA